MPTTPFASARLEPLAADALAAVAAYTPTVLPPPLWALCAPTVHATVAATGPCSARQAAKRASYLAHFLAGVSGWDRTTVPDLAGLLTEEAIGRFTAQCLAAGVGTKTVTDRRRYLRSAARALRTDLPPRIEQGARGRDPQAGLCRAATVEMPVPVPALLQAYIRACAATSPSGRGPVAETAMVRLVTATREQAQATVTGAAAGMVLAPRTIQVLAAMPIAPPRTGPIPSTSTPPTDPSAAPRRPSRRAALRFARANQALMAGPQLAPDPDPVDVPDAVRDAIAAYRPQRVDANAWAQMRDLTVRLVLGYRPPSPNNARSTCSHVVAFLTWFTTWPGRDRPGTPVRAEELLRDGLVETYLRSTAPSVTSRATIRATLRRALGSLHADGRPVRLSRVPVADPYTPAQCAALVRLARHQPTAARRRNLSFIVGLGLGAGLDSRDLVTVTAEHLLWDGDGDDAVLTVRVRGGRAARTVPVRTDLTALVVEALDLHAATGRAPGDFVLGEDQLRRSVTSGALERAVTAGAPPVDPRRLRNTWLLALMAAPVPLADLLHVAGLRSARTLTDLLPHCPDPDPAHVRTAMATLRAAGVDGGEQR